MISNCWIILLFFGCELLAQVTRANTIEDLTTDAFYQRVVTGSNDYHVVIVDVRRRHGEWNEGHIPGATLMESLASYTDDSSTSSTLVGKPTDLRGCEYCDMIVYCRTGARAGRAIQILRNNGFKGRIWNGKGINQWISAGYPLVSTESIVPPCSVNQTVSDACHGKYLSYTKANDASYPTGGNEKNEDSIVLGNQQKRSIELASSSSYTSKRGFPFGVMFLAGGLLMRVLYRRSYGSCNPLAGRHRE